MKIYCIEDSVNIKVLCKENKIECQAKYNTYYTFPIMIKTDRHIENISIVYESLYKGHREIEKERWTCFNLEGIDAYGQAFKKSLNVWGEKILWLGIDLRGIEQGLYKGRLRIKSDNSIDKRVDLSIMIKDHADDQLSRMAWLNSRLGQEDKHLKAFPNIDYFDRYIKVNDKKVRLADIGLIESVEYIEPLMTKSHEILRYKSLTAFNLLS